MKKRLSTADCGKAAKLTSSSEAVGREPSLRPRPALVPRTESHVPVLTASRCWLSWQSSTAHALIGEQRPWSAPLAQSRYGVAQATRISMLWKLGDTGTRSIAAREQNLKRLVRRTLSATITNPHSRTLCTRCVLAGMTLELDVGKPRTPYDRGLIGLWSCISFGFRLDTTAFCLLYCWECRHKMEKDHKLSERYWDGFRFFSSRGGGGAS